VRGIANRGSEPGLSVAGAVVASRVPGRGAWVSVKSVATRANLDKVAG
jgi:hypothetical protein